MKRILLVVAVSTTIVGCASQPKMTVETALHNCMRVGFKVGTEPMNSCIVGQVNQSNQLSFTQQYLLTRAMNPPREDVLPRNIQCSRTGSYVNCTER